jgi:hypothetical protein
MSIQQETALDDRLDTIEEFKTRFEMQLQQPPSEDAIRLAYRNLWCAVLDSAIADLRLLPLKKRSANNSVHDGLKAYEFLTGKSKKTLFDRTLVCNFANKPIDQVEKRARKAADLYDEVRNNLIKPKK